MSAQVTSTSTEQPTLEIAEELLAYVSEQQRLRIEHLGERDHTLGHIEEQLQVLVTRLQRKGKVKEPITCACGCGGTTSGGRFLPGHDAKLKGMMIAVINEASSEEQALEYATDACTREPQWSAYFDAAHQRWLDKAAAQVERDARKIAAQVAKAEKDAEKARLKAERAQARSNQADDESDDESDEDESEGENFGPVSDEELDALKERMRNRPSASEEISALADKADRDLIEGRVIPVGTDPDAAIARAKVRVEGRARQKAATKKADLLPQG